MDTTERASLRQALIAQGLRRTGYTADISGVGDYAETWTHPDGTVTTVQWAPRERDDARPYRVGDTVRVVGPSHGEAVEGAVGVVTEVSYGKRVPLLVQFPGRVMPTGLTVDRVAMVRPAGQPAAPETVMPFDGGVQDAPGMYDEPDEGLAFVLPLSAEEDRIQ